jgi:hypothetical protein
MESQMKFVAGVFVSLVVSLCEIDATRYLLVNVPDGFNLGGGGGGGGGGPPGGEVHPGEKQNAFNFHIKKSLHTLTFFLFPSKANKKLFINVFLKGRKLEICHICQDSLKVVIFFS